MEVIVADDAHAIAEAAARLGRSRVIPLDVESNGLHAYRPRLCTLQLGEVGDGDPDEVVRVVIVDPITAGEAGEEALAPLRAILGAQGPTKIVHDLAFDARILARAGVPLGAVYDTSLAARFLGVVSTGLAALVQARLGVTLSKQLQHHDWARRPIDPAWLGYLAADVAHLPRLARSLAADAEAKGIVEEIASETTWRLEGALAAREDDESSAPPYARIKGANALDPPALATLRELAAVREDLARRSDCPPFKVVGNDALLTLARARPRTMNALADVRGVPRIGSMRADLLNAIARGTDAQDIPPGERAAFFTPPPRPPRELAEARRGREQRLTAWRRAEAKRRGVDEQAVLPGHCLQEIADRAPTTTEELGTVGGIGAFRVARDVEAILGAVAGTTCTTPTNPPAEPPG